LSDHLRRDRIVAAAAIEGLFYVPVLPSSFGARLSSRLNFQGCPCLPWKGVVSREDVLDCFWLEILKAHFNTKIADGVA